MPIFLPVPGRQDRQCCPSEEEAVIVAFRRLHAVAARRLPLCAAANDPTSDTLVIASLPTAPWYQPPAGRRRGKPAKKKFKTYPIGFFHIDIAEVRTEEGKLHLFVAIDRTSKFAYVELHEKAHHRRSQPSSCCRLIAAVPYKIHTVLTDNGIHFTIPGGGGSTVGEIKEAIANGALFRAHAFELACARTISTIE